MSCINEYLNYKSNGEKTLSMRETTRKNLFALLQGFYNCNNIQISVVIHFNRLAVERVISEDLESNANE